MSRLGMQLGEQSAYLSSKRAAAQADTKANSWGTPERSVLCTRLRMNYICISKSQALG